MQSASNPSSNTEDAQCAQGDDAYSDPAAPSVAGLALGTEALYVLSSLGQLAMIEVAIALKGLPQLLWSSIFSAFFMVCFWLSASATVAWWLSDWMNTPLAGLLGFTALQLLGVVICQWIKKYWLHKVTLPHTRKQWRQFQSAFNAPRAN